MLIAQVIKKGWYIDYKVKNIDQIPTRYIPFIRTIGEEKYGTNAVCDVIVQVRRVEPSIIYRRDDMRTVDEREGTSETNGGGVDRHDPRFVWNPGFTFIGGYGNMVQWGCRQANFLVSSLSRGRGGVRVVDVRQLVKIDVDVDVNFYDPNWLLEKKLLQLKALGYDYEDAWWELSPSGKHIHIIILLKDPIPVKELFDLQFLLGDDHKRVYFNYLRYRVMGEQAVHFNVLYKYKKSLTFSDKVKAILRHWFKSKQYSKNRRLGQTT